ncbi:MAG: hypothetical protein M3083_15495 [Actinomycetota bacterium]|nr:hypothetical protein [Actinomycetota bacterium]
MTKSASDEMLKIVAGDRALRLAWEAPLGARHLHLETVELEAGRLLDVRGRDLAATVTVADAPVTAAAAAWSATTAAFLGFAAVFVVPTWSSRAAGGIRRPLVPELHAHDRTPRNGASLGEAGKGYGAGGRGPGAGAGGRGRGRSAWSPWGDLH